MPNWKKNKKRAWESKNENKKTFSEDTSFYHSQAWRKTRCAYINENPLCQCKQCSNRIVPLPGEHVDHIIPIKNGGDPLDWNNLQTLNRLCHNRKSANEKQK